MNARQRVLAITVVGLLTLAGVVALARWLPALLLTAALAAPAVEPWVAPWLGDVARESIEIPAPGAALPADLYRPSGTRAPDSAMLLVHGLSTAGRRQPDLERLARLLGRSGLLVVVPHFDGLAAFRLTGREVDHVRAALRHLRQLAPSIGIAGFSFGAGPAVLAAADADVALVGSFGGYADLENVIAFIVSGAHEFAGRRYRHAAEPYNRWKLAALLVPFVGDERDRARLGAVVAARLADPLADTSALEATLTGEGRSMLALVRSPDEADARRRLAELPPGARAAIEALSPLRAVPRLRGRLLIAHGADDPSIPFTESLRLAAASAGRTRAVVLGGFHHTGPASVWRSAVDAWRLVAVADAVVRLR